MHSGREKWGYYSSVSREVYKTIKENLDKPASIIIKLLNEHLAQYNDKTSLYRFAIMRESKNFEDGNFNFVMFEYTGIQRKILFEKIFNLNAIMRQIKLDDFLNDNERKRKKTTPEPKRN